MLVSAEGSATSTSKVKPLQERVARSIFIHVMMLAAWSLLSLFVPGIVFFSNLAIGAIALSFLTSSKLRSRLWQRLSREPPRKAAIIHGVAFLLVATVAACIAWFPFYEGIQESSRRERAMAEKLKNQRRKRAAAEEARKKREAEIQRATEKRAANLKKANALHKSGDHVGAVVLFESLMEEKKLGSTNLANYTAAAFELVVANRGPSMSYMRRRRLLRVALNIEPMEKKVKASRALDQLAVETGNVLLKVAMSQKAKNAAYANKLCNTATHQLDKSFGASSGPPEGKTLRRRITSLQKKVKDRLQRTLLKAWGKEHKEDAITSAQSAVSERLKSPSSADWISSKVLENSGSKYIIHLVVDAKNAFGASIRGSFCVALRLDVAKPETYYIQPTFGVQKCARNLPSGFLKMFKELNSWSQKVNHPPFVIPSDGNLLTDGEIVALMREHKSGESPPKVVASASPEGGGDRVGDETKSDWWCLCYAEKGNPPTQAAACRRTHDACLAIERAATAGLRAFERGSVSKPCQRFEAAHPGDVLGGREKWRPSSKPGAWWAKGACPIR